VTEPRRDPALYAEDQLLPISALQHLRFCERQCALIHLEHIWHENRLTAEGRALHQRVHETGDETRNGVRIARGLRLRSLRLGLSGVADVVEFDTTTGQPFPVEYKRGKPKPDSCDEVQLCAQAMCLEEMLNTPVPTGALFYGMPRRRTDVTFEEALRRTTVETAQRLHALLADRRTPLASYAKRCENCSLLYLCLPETVSRGKSVTHYLGQILSVEESA
jgi:CRISPR-associated exonuclease Cas4